MKQILKSVIAVMLLVVSTTSFAGNTFTSGIAKCSITFPGEFEAETSEEDGTKTVSVTSVHGTMIYMLIATIYKEPVAEDENDLNELVTLINFANKTGSKIKTKKILSFNVGGEKGFFGFIKPKLNGKKYQGNYYVLIKGNVMYQFTALGVKKGYDERPANRFADSFRFS